MSPTIETAIASLIQIYTFIIFAYIILSWFPHWRASSFRSLLAYVAEPYLRPFRLLIRPVGTMDISPIIAIFTLHLAERGLNFLLQYFY